MKSNKVLSMLLSILLVSSIVFTGCGEKDDAKKDETGKKDGTQTLEEAKTHMDADQYLNLFGWEPESLDPGVTSITTSQATQAPIYEGLTVSEIDENGNHVIKPGVAEKWEPNEKGDEYTFHLRKDAKWSDGVDVTAKDFVYAVQRVVDPKTGSPYSWLFNAFIKNAEKANKGEVPLDEVGIKAIDDHTLKVTLPGPVSSFMKITYFASFYPVRQDIVEKYGKRFGSEADTVVSNGPFVVKEWVHNGKIVFEKNPYYWDKEHVYLNQMTWTMIQDATPRYNALLSGEMDSGGVGDPDWKKKFDETGDYNFVSVKDAACDYLIFNHNNKYLKNAKIRRAISAAIDREDYNKAVAKSAAVPAYEYIPDTVSIGEENFQKKVGEPKYVKKLIDEVKDPKAYLIEGLKEENLDPDPAKMDLTLTLRGSSDYTKREADWYINEFKNKLGITLNVDMLDVNVFYKKLEDGDLALAAGGWSADYNDPSTFIDFFHTEHGNYTKCGSGTKELDGIINDCNNTIDDDERAKKFTRAEEILVYENCDIIPIYHGKSSTYRRKYVYGIQPLTFGFFNYKGVFTSGRK